LLTALPAAAQTTPQEKRKAQIVSRTYQATDGAIETCRDTPHAAAVEKEVSRFRNSHLELMALVARSPYLEAAKRQNRETANDCQDVLAILRSMNDSPEAGKAAAQMAAELRD
jgi:hypothetical protein